MDAPKTYRRKPLPVRAIRYLGVDNLQACMDFCAPGYLKSDYRHLTPEEADEIAARHGGRRTSRPFRFLTEVKTPEGWVELSPGNWLVQGTMGEFYPVTHEIFEHTFDEADDWNLGEPQVTNYDAAECEACQ